MITGEPHIVLPAPEDEIRFHFSDIPLRGVQLYTEIWISTHPEALDGTWVKARKGTAWGILPALWPELYGEDSEAQAVQLLNNEQYQGEVLHVAAVLRMDCGHMPSAPPWEQAFFGPQGVPGVAGESGVPGVPEGPQLPLILPALAVLRTAGAKPLEFRALASGGFTTPADQAPTSDLKWMTVGASDCWTVVCPGLPLPCPLG